MEVYIWLGITCFALFTESVTNELVSIWFVGGGVVSMILAAFGISSWVITVPVFIVVSALLLLLFRRYVLRHINKEGEGTNAQSVIGKDFTLLTPIAFGKVGTIKVFGVVWNAVCENENTAINEGATVTVKSISGNKYIVEEKKGE